MMAPGLITAAVQIKRPLLRLFPIKKTRFVDKPDHEPKTDEEAGKEHHQAGHTPGAWGGLYRTQEAVHNENLSEQEPHSTNRLRGLSTHACSRILQSTLESPRNRGSPCPPHRRARMDSLYAAASTQYSIRIIPVKKRGVPMSIRARLKPALLGKYSCPNMLSAFTCAVSLVPHTFSV